MRTLPLLVLVPVLAWSAAGAASAQASTPAAAAGSVSAARSANLVSCPDTLPVDWAHPRTLRTTSAVTVSSYAAHQRDGRGVTVTVAAAHPGAYRLVARGAPVVGRTSTPGDVVTANRGIVVGVNGGYFWRGTPGQEWSKGAQVRGGQVFYLPAGPSRYVGTDAAGRVSKGWVVPAGSVVTRATPTGRASALPVVAVNAPAAGNGVAVYTRAWSSAQPRRGGTWEVFVKRGVVVSAGPSLRGVLAGSPAAENRFVVRASGTAVAALRRVKVGHRATFSARAVAEDGSTITQATVGGTTLLVGGRVWIGCVREAIRPRTMVAWNTRTGALWLVTSNGAADARRYGMFLGTSHHQMALVAQQLGATDAVLVDGGGSSAMVLRTPAGLRRVDGAPTSQRPVADLLGIAAP